MKSTVDPPALQAFVKVIQTGNFGRAAEALQTQKAHLSRVVSQLERERGTDLVAAARHRRPSGPDLPSRPP